MHFCNLKYVQKQMVYNSPICVFFLRTNKGILRSKSKVNTLFKVISTKKKPEDTHYILEDCFLYKNFPPLQILKNLKQFNDIENPSFNNQLS